MLKKYITEKHFVDDISTYWLELGEEGVQGKSPL